ncbi:hypothetical protein [Chryseobacterium sp. Leaf394]|uniref:hypothetical protein n=1 Tax=Chryseobacterium sp. Leaf394 TaxID=1736361 RepID=UPI0006F56B09|nr:hypothetical protein [Chryseobacterium sp. Leaf394]KQS93967.1 hypothetical protein ASG21_19365 [Chryseobacterium sp. Leaf394]
MYSTQITNNEVNETIINFISKILNIHRTTNIYQLEIEEYDDFTKNQILKYLSKNEEEKIFLNDQFNFKQNAVSWDAENYKKQLNIEFIPKSQILQKRDTHFRFSKPIITLDRDLLIIKVTYQNNFGESNLKGSECVELFRKNELNIWENFTHLFAMSLD